jgi:hypothetical protein
VAEDVLDVELEGKLLKEGQEFEGLTLIVLLAVREEVAEAQRERVGSALTLLFAQTDGETVAVALDVELAVDSQLALPVKLTEAEAVAEALDVALDVELREYVGCVLALLLRQTEEEAVDVALNVEVEQPVDVNVSVAEVRGDTLCEDVAEVVEVPKDEEVGDFVGEFDTGTPVR